MASWNVVAYHVPYTSDMLRPALRAQRAGQVAMDLRRHNQAGVVTKAEAARNPTPRPRRTETHQRWIDCRGARVVCSTRAREQAQCAKTPNLLQHCEGSQGKTWPSCFHRLHGNQRAAQVAMDLRRHHQAGVATKAEAARNPTPRPRRTEDCPDFNACLRGLP